MENPRILIDTSILIDYFRKTRKDKTLLYRLSIDYIFAVSTITEFEFLSGFADKDLDFANKLLENILVLPFDSECVRIASKIYKELRRKNKLILPPDIFIAATAIFHKLPLVTLNLKHFKEISELKILELDKPEV